MQVLAAGRAQGCVAGVLTASTTLTEARPGGLAGPLEGDSSQPSYHSSLLSMPMKLPSPSPSCCGQTLPTGGSHQYHIHGVQQILKENLLCACRVPWRERGSCHSVKQGVPAQMRFVSCARHGSPFQALSYARGLLCAPSSPKGGRAVLGST